VPRLAAALDFFDAGQAITRLAPNAFQELAFRANLHSVVLEVELLGRAPFQIQRNLDVLHFIDAVQKIARIAKDSHDRSICFAPDLLVEAFFPVCDVFWERWYLGLKFLVLTF